MQKSHSDEQQILSTITAPQDICSLSNAQVKMLAKEIRKKIISVVGKNGGHLASNLGVVELTLALHRTFESPKDAFVWDVGHQTYTHKLLTGRYEQFDSLRMHNGLSGFPKKSESEHDFFDTGHSSTSISSALGLLLARRLQHKSGKVIAVIGDGALTGGMAFEALCHAGQTAKDLVVILNDNKMSISKNTGALSRYLSLLTMTSSYQTFRKAVDSIVSRIPLIGEPMTQFIFYFKRGLKGLFFNDNLFVNLGFEYVGPLNGHNTAEMENVLKRVKRIHRPVMVHVVTQKGRGYELAENDPISFHGVGPFSVSDGLVEKFDGVSFTEAFSHAVLALAERDSSIVAITAAMAKGTGLAAFAHRYPDRFFDVGIAEQHAVTFAGGLARAGMKPIVAIYSTFMQRAVDQVIHDVALQNVSVIFALDRSGAVPDDGETHQGIYDIVLFRSIPNMILLAPACAYELKLFLSYAVEKQVNQSVIIRYPKIACPQELSAFNEPLIHGRGVLITHNPQGEKSQYLFVCTGGIFSEVYEAVSLLSAQQICADIYNLRYIKPIDEDYFISLAKDYKYIVFAEDAVRSGGIGEYLQSILQNTALRTEQRIQTQVYTQVCGFPDTFIAQGKRHDILSAAGLSSADLADTMKSISEII